MHLDLALAVLFTADLLAAERLVQDLSLQVPPLLDLDLVSPSADRDMLQVDLYLVQLSPLQPTAQKQSKDRLYANAFAFSLKSFDVSASL